MSKPTEAPHAPDVLTTDVLTDREVVGLILAFMATVILVLTVATSLTPRPDTPSTSSGASAVHATERG